MKKIVVLLFFFLFGGFFISPSYISKAEVSAEIAQVKVETALKDKTFYAFNMAYAEIMKLPDSPQRSSLLARLAVISNEVWTPQVKKAVELLDKVCKLKDGKTYNETEAYLRGLNRDEMDMWTQGYLLGELTSWGRQYVFTVDYSAALNTLLEVGKYKDAASIDKAASAISQVKNVLSRNYLQSELDKYTLTPNWYEPEPISSSQILLQWNKVSGADYYYIYYTFDPETPYQCFKNDDGSKKPFPWKENYSAVLNSLKSSTTIYLKLTSVKNGVESNFSSVVSATTFAAGKGTRTSPLSLLEAQKFILQRFEAEKPKQISLKLLEIYSGDYANSLAAAEGPSNPMPNSDEQWIVMKFKLRNLSGEKQPVKAADVISDNFFTRSGAKISLIGTADFLKNNNGQKLFDIEVYSGQETVFWYGILVKKSAGDNPLIRIGSGYDYSKDQTLYTWFSTN